LESVKNFNEFFADQPLLDNHHVWQPIRRFCYLLIKLCTLGRDAKLQPAMELRFGNSAVLGKLEYPSVIIIPRATMAWSGDAWEGTSYG